MLQLFCKIGAKRRKKSIFFARKSQKIMICFSPKYNRPQHKAPPPPRSLKSRPKYEAGGASSLGGQLYCKLSGEDPGSTPSAWRTSHATSWRGAPWQWSEDYRESGEGEVTPKCGYFSRWGGGGGRTRRGKNQKEGGVPPPPHVSLPWCYRRVHFFKVYIIPQPNY